MANLPFHHYIGPGNPINNGPPVDQDDLIAQIHDTRYAHAQSDQDIHAADNEAIGDFLSNVANPHSAIGAIGLGAKRLFESALGRVVYPDMKRGRYASDDSENSADTLELPIPDSQMPGSGSTLPQAGGSVAGGTGSSIGIDNVLSDNPSGDFATTFSNSFQVYTGAFQFAVNSPPAHSREHGITNIQSNYLSTPLSVIDPNDVLYYMSLTEFRQLTSRATAPYIWATHAEFTITPLGYRLPFATNEAASSFANSQTLVQIATGVGLERHFPTLINGYNNSDANPTNIESYNNLWEPKQMIWGNGYGDIGACVGIPRHHNRYATFLFGIKADVVGNAAGGVEHPRLLQYMDISNVNDVKGGPVVNYTYDFKSAAMSMPTRIDIFGATANERYMGMHRGPLPVTLHGRNLTINTDQVWSNNEVPNIHWDDHTLPLEKAPYMSHFPTQDLSPKSPPLIYFGCLPIQSNAPLTSTATFSPGVVAWKISCKLHVRGSYKNTGNGIPSMMALDPIINSELLEHLNYNHRLFYGGERIIRPNDKWVPPMEVDDGVPKTPKKKTIRKLF